MAKLCGDEAVLIIGDMNVVPEARDRRSGRLQGYTGFWGSVREVRDFTMRGADPVAGTATYTYTYRRAGTGTVTETVELTLQEQPDGGFLISGARTI